MKDQDFKSLKSSVKSVLNSKMYFIHSTNFRNMTSTIDWTEKFLGLE